MQSRKQRGFTLVEMLVVIAIIGILAALLLPAVQAARAAARKAQCTSRMKQVALAAHNFENLRQRFPGHQEVLARDPSGSQLGGNKPVSWLIMIMPNMDLVPLYENYEDSTVNYHRTPFSASAPNPALLPYVDFLVCPSRTSSNRQDPITSYVANSGFFPITDEYPTPDPSPYDAQAAYLAVQHGANGVFVDRINRPNQQVRMADLVDGSSNTVLVSENLLEQCFYHSVGPIPDGMGGAFAIPNGFGDKKAGRLSNTFVWLYAGESAAVDAGKPAPTQVPPAPQSKINGLRSTGLTLGPLTARPSSNHSGGVIMAFADDHTQFVRDSIDYHVYQQLMTPQGKKSDMPRYRYLLKDTDYK